QTPCHCPKPRPQGIRKDFKVQGSQFAIAILGSNPIIRARILPNYCPSSGQWSQIWTRQVRIPKRIAASASAVEGLLLDSNWQRLSEEPSHSLTLSSRFVPHFVGHGCFWRVSTKERDKMGRTESLAKGSS